MSSENVTASQFGRTYKIPVTEIKGYANYRMGYDPIEKDLWDSTRVVQFSLESILFMTRELDDNADWGERYAIDGTPVMDFNWNPFVYVGGEKKYYQRGFVWTLEQNQMLLESLYQGVDCGKVLVRKRGFSELRALHAKGERELSFNDIVDGKQRLNAIIDFVNGKYPDAHGMYYGDLTPSAQNDLTNNQLLSYSEMPEGSKDEMVLKQFLRLNFTGIPQSKEHIEYVKSLLK